MLGITFVEGRPFTPEDRATSPKVCIINESLAKRLFPGESALGKVLLRGPNADIQNEIVGVIHDVKTIGINAPTPDEIYHPVAQLPRPTMAVAARINGDASSLQKVIADAVRAVDPNQPTTFFATLDANVAASMGTQRVVATLTLVFAAIALLLAAIGLYSVLAYLVSQRTAEIGVRMALGAARRQVIGLIMRSGLQLVAIGLAVGLVAAGATARLIQSLLFNVTPFDPIVYFGVAALFVSVAAFACLMPSLRASRIDPLIALQGN
jgi:putative ABC transport system permease protein